MCCSGQILARCLAPVLTLLFLGLTRTTAADAILSAIEGKEHAAVSTANGVFIAPRSGGPWKLIPHPHAMPPGGLLSGNPDPGEALYCVPFRTYQPPARQGAPAQPLPTDPAWQYGLYRRSTNGTGWDRISDDLGLLQVLPIERHLFALTHRLDQPEHRQKILVSTNGGSGWRDLAELPANRGYIHHLFRDPDAPAFPAALASGIRVTILRLTPDHQRWEELMAHRMPAAFLAEAQFDLSAWASPEAPRIPLELSNYFQFPSHSRIHSTSIPTAWIGVGGRRRFQRDSEVVVVARIRIAPGFPVDPARQFIDSGDDRRAWGFRRWTPSGGIEHFPPVGIPKEAKTRESLPVCASDDEPGVLLKLSDRAPFREVGRHRIQLMYDTVESSRRSPSEWAVRLLSEPFDIDVQ